MSKSFFHGVRAREGRKVIKVCVDLSRDRRENERAYKSSEPRVVEWGLRGKYSHADYDTLGARNYAWFIRITDSFKKMFPV